MHIVPGTPQLTKEISRDPIPPRRPRQSRLSAAVAVLDFQSVCLRACDRYICFGSQVGSAEHVSQSRLLAWRDDRVSDALHHRNVLHNGGIK